MRADLLILGCRVAIAAGCIASILLSTGIVVAGCIWIGKCLIMGAC